MGLRARDAYRVLGGWNAAVGAGLNYWFGTALKFRDLGFEFLYLLALADKIPVQDFNGKGLLVKFLRKFRRVKILSKPHGTKELLAPAG